MEDGFFMHCAYTNVTAISLHRINANVTTKLVKTMQCRQKSRGAKKNIINAEKMEKNLKDKSEELLKRELITRKKNNLPPFVRLIAIIISSNQHDLSIKGAKEIKISIAL